MMVIDRKTASWTHHSFAELPSFLKRDDLLIFNQSKVFPSRLLGEKLTGGKVECFLLSKEPGDRHVYNCLLKSSKSKTNLQFKLPGGVSATVIDRNGDDFVFRVQFRFDASYSDMFAYAEQHGHIPLPPYISRDDDDADHDRYQTVYAKEVGSVAAPTAGLHFTDEILQEIRHAGVSTAEITLHVGLGTFQPIRSENILDHKMHSEFYEVSLAAAEQIDKVRASGTGKCIAIGTTSVRCLESAALQASLAGVRTTDLFIYPGFEFKLIDGMLTNFHQPRSSLLVMLSAFVGRDLLRAAYESAVKERYRFFSYGDCMLIL